MKLDDKNKPNKDSSLEQCVEVAKKLLRNAELSLRLKRELRSAYCTEPHASFNLSP